MGKGNNFEKSPIEKQEDAGLRFRNEPIEKSQEFSKEIVAENPEQTREEELERLKTEVEEALDSGELSASEMETRIFRH